MPSLLAASTVTPATPPHLSLPDSPTDEVFVENLISSSSSYPYDYDFDFSPLVSRWWTLQELTDLNHFIHGFRSFETYDYLFYSSTDVVLTYLPAPMRPFYNSPLLSDDPEFIENDPASFFPDLRDFVS
jgi:hypothetical protein